MALLANGALPARVVETIGFTVADEDTMRTWIEQFRAEDAPIRRRTDQTIP